MAATIEEKRNEYRKYLEESGVINALTKALIRLYETQERPDCAIRYVREQMCETCPTEAQYETLQVKYEQTLETVRRLDRELATVQGNLKRTPSDIELLLDEGMNDLEADADCKSLLKKHLTRELFVQLKGLKTSMGSTLLDCIQSGLTHHSSGVGIYAADTDAYTTFADLFDPVIEEYHVGFGRDAIQGEAYWGDPTQLVTIDPDEKYVISTRVRCGRSLDQKPLQPRMTEPQYVEVMNEARHTLENLEGELKGTFHELMAMPTELQIKLVNEHFLFKSGDKYLEAARAVRYWPVGRAIYYNEDKTFLVWINEEDHFRFISMQPGGDLATIYQRLITAVEKCGETLKFARHPRLGFVTLCPTNLGTTLRASVHIRLPMLHGEMDRLLETAARYNLQVRGTGGEHTDAVDSIFDVSNKRRIGLTEFEAVQEMCNGIAEIIKLEQELEGA